MQNRYKALIYCQEKGRQPNRRTHQGPSHHCALGGSQAVHQRIRRALTLSVIRKTHIRSTRAVSLAAAENGSVAYFKGDY